MDAFLIPQSKASTLGDKQDLVTQLQAESSQTYNKISQEKKQAKSIQNNIQAYTSSIDNIRKAVTTNQQQLQKLRDDLNKLDQQISQTQTQLAKDKLVAQQLIRVTYENGSVSYLSVLFNATSLDDFLSRWNALTTLSKDEHALFQKVTDLQNTLTKQNDARKVAYQVLSQKNHQLEFLESTNVILRDHQKRSLADYNQKIHAATVKQNRLESQIHLTQSQIQKIQEETAQAEALMQNKDYVEQATKNLATANPEDIIRYAESYVGLPYIWGGITPSPGFDCSGFTQYVFRHFGINIARTAEEQFAEGVPVSRSNLQAGDLVFFSTYAPGASHVGIYVGNGMMVNSEDAGLIVTDIFSNSYWAPRYIGARDFIKH